MSSPKIILDQRHFSAAARVRSVTYRAFLIAIIRVYAFMHPGGSPIMLQRGNAPLGRDSVVPFPENLGEFILLRDLEVASDS